MKNLKQFKYFLDKKSTVEARENHLYLYGEIGAWFDDNEAKQIIGKIRGMEGDITVHVNSEGGSVFDGIAIMNALRQHKGKKNFIIEGLFASISAIITLGCADHIRMMTGSCLMLHKAWSLAIGNAKELRHQAEILDSIDGEIMGIAQKRSGIAMTELEAKFNNEWWMFAQEAKANGFCDEIESEQEASFGNLDLSAFNNVPTEIRNRLRAVKPQNARELESALKSLGFSAKEAKTIISNGYTAQRDAEPENRSNEMLLGFLCKRTKALG